MGRASRDDAAGQFDPEAAGQKRGDAKRAAFSSPP
jgi:hypothetical protein